MKKYQENILLIVLGIVLGAAIVLLSGCAKSWRSVQQECFTDICITERTGDINPADPSGHSDQHVAFDED